MQKTALWKKIAESAGKAGKEIIHQALLLYYAYPYAPRRIQAVIASAIAYFILPLDAVPDPIPVAGFLDDATVLAAALAVVRFYVNDEVKQKAQITLGRVFKRI